jgi:cystathionine beta-lyase
MSSRPDLDRFIPRAGTGSVKWEYREGAVGHGSTLVPADDPEVIPMWVADMDFACPPVVIEAIRRRAEHPIFGYSMGLPGYREAFCGWMEARHGFRPDPDWIVPTEGIVPDLGLLVRTFLEPGRGVVLHPPVYFPFFGAVRNNGARMHLCPLRREDGPEDASANPYRLDLDRFEKLAADPETRMTFLCTPHNPVGRVWDAQELTAFAEIAARHGLIVVADEIHGDLMLDGRTFTPWLSLPHPRGLRSVVCSAPSKTFNLAGLKSSCLVIPDPELRLAYQHARDHRGLYGVNPLSAAAAEAAWREGGPWLDEVLAYVSDNVRVLRDFFRARPELNVGTAPVEGTYLAWLDFRRTGIAADDLEGFLLDKARLRLEDGAIFGAEGRGFMRLNLACPRPLLEEALGRLESALGKR